MNEEELPEVLEEEAAAEAAAPAAGVEFISIPPQITFEVARVAPPSELYIGPGDELLVNVCTSYPGAWLAIMARLLRPDGVIVPMEWSIRPQGNRLNYSRVCPLTEGYLLSLALVPIGVVEFVKHGQMWVQALIYRSGDFYRLLLTGYATAFRVLSWPGAGQESSVEGSGYIRSITGTDPAPGLEFVETVPVNARWRPILVYYTLSTSATAILRYARLAIDDGTNLLAILATAMTQGASCTGTYVYGGGLMTTSLLGLYGQGSLPAHLSMRAWYRLRTITENLQAGDNYSAPQLLVEEWLEP